MKRGKNVLILGLCMVFAVLLVSSIASAGFFDNFKKTITGKATSQATNLTVGVVGANKAQVTVVSAISSTNPTEADVTTITFDVQMYDSDGVADLNDTSVSANFTRAGESTRANSSCAFKNDIDANTANYSCSIEMWYYDENGDWNISVTGTDYGNLSFALNLSTVFQLNLLKALVISPNTVSWATLQPNTFNQTSDNDPVTINNTGNYNSTIQVNAIGLMGEDDGAYQIFAGNFSLGLATGSSTECDETFMVNATNTVVTGSVSNRGNISEGSGLAQEDFYYCITEIGAIASQTYSTLNGGSWTVLY